MCRSFTSLANAQERKRVAVLDYMISWRDLTLKERLGEAIIEVSPGGVIFIDGVEQGEAPKKLSLRRGIHELVVKQDGFRDYRRSIMIEEAKRAEVSVNLGQHPTVDLSCFPETATVWIKGLPKGKGRAKHSASPGEWLLACKLGDAEVTKRVKVIDGEVKRVDLEISNERIKTLRARGQSMRTWGWTLLASGAGLMLGGGGLWLGPTQSAADSRDQAYNAYINANPMEADARIVTLAEADNSLQQWQNTSLITAASGAVISAVGGLLLGLAPSVEEQMQQRGMLDEMRHNLK